MSEQSEQTRQSDWTLPPNCGSGGISNVVAVSAGATPVIIDLTTIPAPSGFLDAFGSARGSNPLGHFINIQAQNADAYVMFGSSVAAMTTGQVAGTTITGSGSGYTAVPAVTFSSGGGSGAAGTAVLSGGVVSSITITAAGSGYTSAPTIAISGGATATATIGASPSATTFNAVSATGAVTLSAGTCAWIPQTQTLPVKVPVGSPQQPWGTNSPWRYLAIVCPSSGGAVARIWQSSI